MRNAQRLVRSEHYTLADVVLTICSHSERDKAVPNGWAHARGCDTNERHSRPDRRWHLCFAKPTAVVDARAKACAANNDTSATMQRTKPRRAATHECTFHILKGNRRRAVVLEVESDIDVDECWPVTQQRGCAHIIDNVPLVQHGARPS